MRRLHACLLTAWVGLVPACGGPPTASPARPEKKDDAKVTPAAAPAQDVTTLNASGLKGLLGVFLPEGAGLTMRTSRDAQSMRGPSEDYSIDASAENILAFFDKETRAAGWERLPQDLKYSRLYRKGKLQLSVLADAKGGSFKLTGS